jgi:hypothetical protein
MTTILKIPTADYQHVVQCAKRIKELRQEAAMLEGTAPAIEIIEGYDGTEKWVQENIPWLHKIEKVIVSNPIASILVTS